MKLTKIICTIGPKTEKISDIYNLVKNGMNITRLNLSHGSYKDHLLRIKNIRYISKKVNKYIPIILDTKGPEIRIYKFSNKLSVYLKKNQEFIFINELKYGNSEFVSTNFKELYKYVNVNNFIFLDDGYIKMRIININNKNIICKVLNSGYLEEKKKINIIGINFKFPYISEIDKEDIIFGCKNKVNFIALSFVRNINDILEVRKIIKNYSNRKILLISKIENISSIKNINSIIKESDGIMIARGDLGINIPIQNVIIEQKKIIKKCNDNNIPVIVATHMLESMIKNFYPTRAEISDISNSIIDGSDCVMLSGETAKGEYPIESVKIMNKICTKTDNFLLQQHYNNNIFLPFSNKIKLIVIITNSLFIINNFIKIYKNNFFLIVTENNFLINKLFLFSKIFIYKLNKINFKKIFLYIKLFILKNKILKNKNKYIIFFNLKLKINGNLNSFLINKC